MRTKYIILAATLCLLFYGLNRAVQLGNEQLAGMAEEYSICAETNLCSSDEVAQVAALLIEQGHYRNIYAVKLQLGLSVISIDNFFRR